MTASAAHAAAMRSVRDPYTGEVVGSYRTATSDEVAAKLQIAREAVDGDALTAHRRAAVLDRAAELLAAHRDELASLITGEVGKPIREARGEVGRAIDTVRFSAAAVRTMGATTVPADASGAGAGKLGLVLRVPVGVVAAITPFNFPLNLVAHKVAPAFGCGNAVIVKPAPQGALTAVRFVELLVEAGAPASFVQLVAGDEDVGRQLVDSPDVDAVSFTGSVAAGWSIRAAAPTKRVLLELGSNAPLLVCESADVDRAAAAVAAHGFANAGQACVSVQRVIVASRVASAFMSALLEHVARLRVGDPRDELTDVGPVCSTAARQRIVGWIDEAVRDGARVAAGGRLNPDGTIAPTVLERVPAHAAAWRDELFGPVICVVEAESFDEQVRLANDSRFGLQAGVFTASVSEALDAARRLRFGGVAINDTPTTRLDGAPYGGVRDSGDAREGPESTMRALTHERLVTFQA